MIIISERYRYTMNLRQYYEKNIRIVDVDGNTFEGQVTDYIYPGDDETDLESIIVDCTRGKLAGKSVEFWEKDIKSIETMQAYVMASDPCPNLTAEDVLMRIKNIKTEEDLAKLFALSENKAWWVEDNVYDYEEGTTEYLKACEIRDKWFNISDELRERIFAILRKEKVSIPQTRQRSVLIPFMEQYGFFDGDGWWLLQKK